MLQLVNRYEPLVVHLSQLHAASLSGCTPNCWDWRGLHGIHP